MTQRVPLRWSLVALAAAAASLAPSPLQAQTFNYAEALQKAIFFYEAQISGPKPSWNRVTWRGDSAMQDGSDVGRNLTGGWFDAGDHVKFGFAMASSATMLAWGAVDYRAAFESKGQLVHLQNNLRVANDYFIRAHTAPNELWGQVGNGDADHSFWGAAEIMHLRTVRPSYRIFSGCGGADLAAETAAAMAASSIVFRPTDPTYANTLVSHARQLFAFAEATNPSWYADCMPAAPFYNSRDGRPEDEVTWAAVWLFRATGEQQFMDRARALYPTMCRESQTSTPCFTWTQSWNDKHFGTYVLMSRLTNEAVFHTDAQRWLDYWSVGQGFQTRTTQPGGLMFVHNFGSLRYATNTAFIALLYADFLGTSNPLYARYHAFAKRQVDYVLGANPRNSSYMVGFGSNPPRNPHHRTAHGTWLNQASAEPNPSRHTLYGAMVAGPDAQSDTAWSDDRQQFMRTEPATDMNAGLTGALARLAQEFGGNPLANFPPVETPANEIFMEATINQSGPNFTEIKAFLNNQSAWPARNLTQGTFRYYFNLEPGLLPSQITLNGNFSQCGSGNLSGPTLFSGNTYFVTVSCVGTPVYPGGQSEFRREVQFRMTAPNTPGSWDTSNDYSIVGLPTTPGSTPVLTRRIVAFDGPTKVWGDEPGSTPDFALSASPASVTVVRGQSATSTITVTRTGGFTGSVAFSTGVLPAGVTAAFSPASTTGTTSTLTLTASATATLGGATVVVTGASGTLSHTTNIALTVNNVQPPDFSLAAAPPSVSVTQGGTGSTTINITRLNGFTAGVAFTTSPLPTGVTASFNPTPAAGNSSVLTFTASATATTGTTNVTVTGTGGGLSRTTTVALTVNAPANFTLAAAPPSLSVAQGNSGSTTINITRTGGFTAAVAFSASPLPTGVTASFNPGSATGNSSVLTFTASATATLGTTNVTVTGTGGGLSRTTTVALTITQVQPPDFSLAAAPATLSVPQGQSGTSTINITRLGGFTAAVAFTNSALPTGVTASFNPASATGNSSVLTFTASATAATGTTNVTVTGTGGGLTRTTTVALTITPVQPADFTLSAAPAAVTVNQGATASSTINIARTGGFTAGVTFSTSALPAGVTAGFSASPATGNSSVLTFTATATAATGTSTVTVTGTGGGLTRTAGITLTVSTGGGGGGVTVTPLVNQNQPYFNELAVRVENTGTLTALSATVVIQRTTGVSFSGQYNTVGGQILQSNTSTATAITYQWTLSAGQTLGTGPKLFAAQAGGTGTLHPVAGDTWTITYTTGGQTFTQSGTFGGGGGGDFSLAASPASLTIGAGLAGGTSTINITRTGGFTGAVAFTASGLPSGVTASFNPASATGNSSVVTLTAAAGAAGGTFPVTITGTSGSLSHTTTISLTVALPADFSFSPPPAAVTVARGSSASTTVTLARSSFTASVALSASGQGTGVTAAFAPASTTGNTSQLTFTASGTAALGVFPVTITGTGGGLTRTTTVTLTVVDAANFSVAASPAALSIAAGGSGTTTLTVTRTGGFAASVTCSLSGLPTGGTGTFNPASITGTSSVLTIVLPPGTAPGTYTITITCTGGGLTRTTTITITVPAAQDFSLTACTPAPIVVQGGSTTCPITIVRTNFTGSISFAATGLPAGVTASFNPASTTGNSTVLTLTASATATLGTASVTVTGTATGLTPRTATVSLTVNPPSTVNAYTQRFLDLYDELHGLNGQGNNGYFHPSNIPYHSIETLMVEAPDHGHQTTSEAYSFWGWLEVMRGRITGDWTGLQQMWDSMEANIIPTAADQPTTSFYTPGDPADYAPEADLPSGYPALISSSVPVGTDPIGGPLETTYGTKNIYGMHWIIDVDNFYGYGRRGDGVSQPSYMNTFQRGPQESTWETVPHPSWDDFLSGGSTTAGFLPLFITGPTPAQQWRYTNAPDADARLIQAMYWANQFAPTNPTVQSLSAKAGRMGDYLRYAMFDKYFKTMGCASTNCPAGTGYNAAHYLLSWYYAWGGPIPPQSGWSFRIGSSHNHFGYQNPMAAHALTTVAALRPASGAQAQTDWTTSLRRQIEFYRWLQSADGGIGGGATNSLGGRYLAPAQGTATFYGMFYQENPVYLDPGSNTWFGFQVWSMERVAEYYEETNSPEAKIILDKWIPWAMANTILNADGTFLVPSTLAWSGQPSLNWNATTQNWSPTDTTFNANLRVTVTERGTDLGVTAALAKTLIYYSAGTRRWATQHTASQTLAKELLDRMWTLYRDSMGVSAPESRADYNRFDDPIFVPAGFSGTMANGDPITPQSTFISIRSGYLTDPNFAQVQAYLNGGPAPTFRYHRFWAQADVALANAEYGRLFP